MPVAAAIITDANVPTFIACIKVAAQCRCTALLNSPQCLVLCLAQLMLRTVSLPAKPKNIGYLVLGPAHGPLPLGQQIRQPFHPAVLHMDITRSRAHVGVAQQRLYRQRIHPVFQQVGGKTMAQHMYPHFLLQVNTLAGLLEHGLYRPSTFSHSSLMPL